MKTQLKKEFKDKLLKARAYRKWERNTRVCCKTPPACNFDRFITMLNDCPTFEGFIYASFTWHRTPEGHEFWDRIANF